MDFLVDPMSAIAEADCTCNGGSCYGQVVVVIKEESQK